MQYSESEVVYFEVREISSALLYELKEFLRVNVIVPIKVSSGDNNGGGSCYYSGFFAKKSTEAIEKWFKERGFQKTPKL